MPEISSQVYSFVRLLQDKYSTAGLTVSVLSHGEPKKYFGKIAF